VSSHKSNRIKSAGALSRTQLGYILVSPALLMIAFVSVYPFFTTLWYSLHSIRLNVPGMGRPFVGLENFVTLLGMSRFQNSILLTFKFAGTFVTLQIVFGLFIAMVLNLSFKGRAFVRASILIPWAMASVITAILWKWMYNAVFGVINAIFLAIHITSGPIDFLGGSGFSAFMSVLVVEMWRETPFVCIVLLAGLQSIPHELYEAAKIDGAGRVSCFWSITLPQLKHAMLVALLFRSINALRAFDLLYVMTAGGPGTETEIASLFAYRTLFQYLDFGNGSASTVVLAFFTTVLSLIYINTIRVRE
jgi:ABC-type sugar transport system permease subunit